MTGVIYLEMELDSSFGDDMVAELCYLLFGDSKFLEAYATDYKTNTAVQYLTLDPYTGAPISAGYTYEGAQSKYLLLGGGLGLCHSGNGSTGLVNVRIREAVEEGHIHNLRVFPGVVFI